MYSALFYYNFSVMNCWGVKFNIQIKWMIFFCFLCVHPFYNILHTHILNCLPIIIRQLICFMYLCIQRAENIIHFYVGRGAGGHCMNRNFANIHKVHKSIYIHKHIHISTYVICTYIYIRIYKWPCEQYSNNHVSLPHEQPCEPSSWTTMWACLTNNHVSLPHEQPCEPAARRTHEWTRFYIIIYLSLSLLNEQNE